MPFYRVWRWRVYPAKVSCADSVRGEDRVKTDFFSGRDIEGEKKKNFVEC